MEQYAPALAASLPSFLAIPTDVSPVDSSFGAPVARMGLVVVIGRDDALTFTGQPVRLDELADRFADELALIEREQRAGRTKETPPVYVWADAGSSVGALRAVVSAVPDALTPQIAVAGPRRTPQSYEDSLMKDTGARRLRDHMSTGDASMRATVLAEQITIAIYGCRELAETFAHVASVPVQDKGRHIAEQAPVAMRACGCRMVNPDMVEYALASMLGAFERPVHAFALRFEPAARTQLTVAATGTVSELVAALETLPAGTPTMPVALAP